ncbi:helix-turn-helix domain-containing protein [Xanthovirga aplysinae]|uniref:helix-turn-helix domain-containing protein n=1 Tax=Xanthovirga aplysinae TaxID=2529853 RepID=UPI0012BBC72F|nr:helix-turn-helix domain-containing protein [Xanthovirga aplysinae]MTI29681.1 DNA-binding protein [Xanthovirga aplysinae]
MNASELITRQDLFKFKTDLLKEFKELIGANKSALHQKKWLKSSEVRKLLNISPGTLQNLRITGVLPYTKMGQTLYYAYEDILQILEKNKVSEED